MKRHIAIVGVVGEIKKQIAKSLAHLLDMMVFDCQEYISLTICKSCFCLCQLFYIAKSLEIDFSNLKLLFFLYSFTNFNKKKAGKCNRLLLNWGKGVNCMLVANATSLALTYTRDE